MNSCYRKYNKKKPKGKNELKPHFTKRLLQRFGVELEEYGWERLNKRLKNGEFEFVYKSSLTRKWFKIPFPNPNNQEEPIIVYGLYQKNRGLCTVLNEQQFQESLESGFLDREGWGQ